MKVGREQPSILEAILARSSKTMPSGGRSGSINMLTGSVKVAASQSNTVVPGAGLGCPVAEDSQESAIEESKNEASLVVVQADLQYTDASLEGASHNKPAVMPGATLECPGDSLKTNADGHDHSALAHPIKLPGGCPHALARIGLVADGVGPKKPKTGKSQQSRPVVEPLLGVVRG